VLYIFMERFLSIVGLAAVAVIASPVVAVAVTASGALWPVVPIIAGMGAAVHLAGGTSKDNNNKKNNTKK
jgi:hypothetical protein